MLTARPRGRLTRCGRRVGEHQPVLACGPAGMGLGGGSFNLLLASVTRRRRRRRRRRLQPPRRSLGRASTRSAPSGPHSRLAVRFCDADTLLTRHHPGHLQVCGMFEDGV
eukprot:361809-Chlamydomonas_euryale.AAC.8